METLGKLDAAALAQHEAALVAMLEDSDEDVRRAAVETLGKLDAAALAQHAAALGGRLEDSDAGVQIAARFAMHKLEPSGGHMDALVAMLEDSDGGVRWAAVRTLGELDLATLAPYEQALAKAAKADEGMEPGIWLRGGAANLLAKLRAGE